MTHTRTRSVCLLCLKRFGGGACGEEAAGAYQSRVLVPYVGLGQQVPTDGNRDHNLYSRFLLFTSRYLKISASETFLQCARDHKATTGESIQAFCEDCQVLISHVVDLYAELQAVKLHLLKKVEDLENLTRLSTRRISPKLSRGLIKSVTEQLKIKSVRQLDLYRKSIIINCKRKINGTSPKVLVPRGLFPDYWKYTYSATQYSLVRLITVFALASSRLIWKPKEEKKPESKLRKAVKRRSGPLSRRKVAFADIQNHFKEAAVKVKSEGALVKREAGAEEEENSLFNADDDDRDDHGFPDTGADDNDSDWSRGAASPSGSLEGSDINLNSENEDDVPPKRRRLRRRRSSGTAKDGPNTESDEDFDPDAPESGSKRKRSSKRHLSLEANKDATLPCKICDKLFIDRRGLSKHMLKLHNTHLGYNCEICGLKMNSYLEYATHKRTAHKIRKGQPRTRTLGSFRGRGRPRYKQKYVYKPPAEDSENATLPCTVCNRKFVDGRGLARHMINLHKSHIDYTCHICGHKSKTALDHVQHKSKNHRQRRGPRPFVNAKIEKETNCKECGIEFSTRDEYLEHDKTVHDGTLSQCRFECPMCMKRYTSEMLFRRHLLCHEMDSALLRLFHCEVCGKTFPKEDQLSYHFVTVHEGFYGCTMCDAKYPSAKFLRFHLETHETDQKNYFCNFCYRSYTNEQYWQVHRKSAHAGKERIFCDQDRCPEEFNTVQELNEHLKIHLEEMQSERAKACGEMEAVVQTENGQEPADSSETEKKPVAVAAENSNCDATADQHDHQILTCTVCGWGFLNKRTYNIHQLVHIPYIKEDGGYTCPFKDCTKVVRLKDNLITHYNRTHGDKEFKPYKCHECEANYSHFFWYKTHLKLHEERKSGRKFICETCNEEFEDSVRLNVHRKNHHPKADNYDDPSSPGGDGIRKKRYPRGTGRPRGRPRRKPKTEEERAKELEEEAKLKCSCDVCQEPFENGYKLRKHLEKCHEIEVEEADKPIQCNFCNFKFVHMQTCKLHVTSIHMQKYKFVCDADRCDGVFENVDLLNEHLKKVHLEAPPVSSEVMEIEGGNGVSETVVTIEESPKDPEGEGQENQNSTQAVTKQSDEGVVKVTELTYCKTCNWGFTCADYAELHELCHIPIVGRSYICPSCSSPFSSIGKLSFHYNKNHGKNMKPFKCLECPGRFYSKAGLKYHVYRHDRRRNLDPNQKVVCIECDREFLDHFQLKIHMKIHDPNTHLICPEGCGEKFVDKTRLSEHLKRKHGQGERYPCPICGLAFVYEYELKKHLEWVHEPPRFECEICHKKLRRPGALKKHMESHEPETAQRYMCSECGKPFRSEEGLKYHIGSIHTPDHMKKYPCPYCTYKSHRKLLWRNHLVTCTKNKGIPYDEEKFGKPPVVNKPKPTGRPPGRPPGWGSGGGGQKRRSKRKKKEESDDDDEEEMEEKTTTEEEEDDDDETEEKAEVEEKPEPEIQHLQGPYHQMPHLTPATSNNPMINAIIANITGIPEIANMNEDPPTMQTRGKRGRKKKETTARTPPTSSTIDQRLFQSIAHQQPPSSQPSLPSYPQLFGNNPASTQYQSWLNTTPAAAVPSSSSSHIFPQQQYHQPLSNSHSNHHHGNDSSGTPSPHMMQHQQMYSPNHVYSPPLPDQPQNLLYSDRRK